jgi:hypothetical protein
VTSCSSSSCKNNCGGACVPTACTASSQCCGGACDQGGTCGAAGSCLASGSCSSTAICCYGLTCKTLLLGLLPTCQ